MKKIKGMSPFVWFFYFLFVFTKLFIAVCSYQYIESLHARTTAKTPGLGSSFLNRSASVSFIDNFIWLLSWFPNLKSPFTNFLKPKSYCPLSKNIVPKCAILAPTDSDILWQRLNMQCGNKVTLFHIFLKRWRSSFLLPSLLFLI